MRTVVWNVDDVLNNLTETWLSSYCSAHPNCGVRYEDLISNPPHEVLGISQLDYMTLLDAFRPVADADMEPRWTVLDWLWKQGRDYRHIALTSRPLSCASSAGAWVLRHLGDYIRTFAVVPYRISREIPQFDRDKISYLRWLGHYTVLVDDDLNTVGAARRAGLRAILFPQPWNQNHEPVDHTLSKLSALLTQ